MILVLAVGKYVYGGGYSEVRAHHHSVARPDFRE